MKHKTILTFLTIFLSLAASAIPARKGIIPLTQPDGSTFNAVFRGDEFIRIKTTLEGHAIIQDHDGWWSYAYFNNDGQRFSSGCHVGGPVPSGILSQSRMIPYGKLHEKAAIRKRAMEGFKGTWDIAERMKTATRDGEIPTKHGIIILAQFKDVHFRYTREDFNALLTENGYSAGKSIGSAKDYFDAQFKGRTLFDFQVSDIVTLNGNMASYGGNNSDGEDKDPAQMVVDACRLADEQIDFSQYDDDNDGFIDNVFVFFAGNDEAEGGGEDCIWSHSWAVYSGAGYNVTLDGKTLNRYACTSELSKMGDGTTDSLAGIGTFCHEYSHTFGLPDFYDTDYEESGGEAAGLWYWTALMDGGNLNMNGYVPPYYNAIEREILGLCTPVKITEDGTYLLEPIHLNGQAYRIDTDNEDEYFLIECRSGEEWDQGIGGSGMLIYHIDQSSRTTGWSDSYSKELTAFDRWARYNEVNCRPDHQCADLLEADGRQDAFSESETGLHRNLAQNVNGVFFPYTDVTSAGPDRFGFWSGEGGEFSLTNIKKTEKGVTFSVIGFSEDSTPPVPVSITAEAFPDAAIVLFESDMAFEGEAIVEWGRTGQSMEEMRVHSYEPGKFAAILEGLQPGNKTYTVTVAFVKNDIIGESRSASFMTKKAPAVSWPYIYMNQSLKSSDGSFAAGTKIPLRVFNAGNAAEIIWTFDGMPARGLESGYFRIEESGTLKAEILWEDGGRTVIEKEIIIGKED